MTINPSIFRAYDIRGRVPGELDVNLARVIGYAFARLIADRYGVQNPRIILSRDVRLSSPEIAGAAREGLISGGALVTDTGITSSPMHYWIVGTERADGGIMVTASHNPKDYNGFKLTGREAEALGTEDVKRAAERLVGRTPEEVRNGGASKRQFLNEYVDFFTSGFSFGPLAVAADASNGAAGMELSAVFARFPTVRLHPLYFEPDGNFPNHEPDPLREEMCRDLSELIVSRRADLGIIFDGDGDRVFFLDERGKRLPGDLAASLLAARVLADAPGGAVVYNASVSRIVKETIAANGGRPVPSRTGHTFMQRAAREAHAVFGGEHSGHFYFPESFFAESAIRAVLLVMDLVTKSGKSLSELVKPLERYVHSGEINFPLRDWESLESAIRREFAGGEIAEIDGITIEFPDWGFNLRRSNTEPLIRLNVEARDAETLRREVARLSEIIKGA